MNDAQKMLDNMFEAYKHTSNYKDSVMMEIMLNREKFEKNLDDMWRLIAVHGVSQMTEYNNGVRNIKNAGLKVLRNSAGKHKIAYKN